MSEIATPPFSAALARVLESRLLEVHTAIPAMVEAYDATRQRCSAQPLLLRGYKDERGERRTEKLPVVQDVPVFFSGGRVVYPIAAGDIVLLLCAEASIDRAFDKLHDPGEGRRFSLNDAIALPLITKGPTIEITDTEVRIGGSAPLLTRDEFLNHNHPTAPTGPISPPQTISPPGLTGTAGFPGTPVVRG